MTVFVILGQRTWFLGGHKRSSEGSKGQDTLKLKNSKLRRERKSAESLYKECRRKELSKFKTTGEVQVVHQRYHSFEWTKIQGEKVQENFTSPNIRREAQGVCPSSIHSSDKVQGEIAGVSPLTEEKSLCKKENDRDLFGRNHNPL
jgi:hypothetical protein